MTTLFRRCLNWKVLAGLAVAGLVVGLLVPNVFGRILPLLFLAACPLSMLLMMRGKNYTEATPITSTQSEDVAVLRTRMAELAAEQERIAERLARVATGREKLPKNPA